MGSNTKKRTTMAKMARENALRERRLRKQARRDARKQEAPAPAPAADSAEPRSDAGVQADE
jgi:lysozyme family protein